MKKYRIVDITLPKHEYAQLQAIGVDIGVEIMLQADSKQNHLCFVTIDNSRFCLRKKILKNIILEEVIA
ncbi:hypothetical protein AwErysi_06530 [Erysipelotrichaceae bacterium]|nr:hypothetical protein AwErysi_06530 [Erysipelotrichaceae bacterium]